MRKFKPSESPHLRNYHPEAQKLVYMTPKRFLLLASGARFGSRTFFTTIPALLSQEYWVDNSSLR
jgi:hypothetical protein